MFTNAKKRKYRTYLLATIIVLLCILIVIIAWPTPKSDNPNINANANTGTDSTLDGSNPFPDDIDDEDEENNKDYEEKTEKDRINDNNGVINPSSETYYVVKRADNAIKVFFMNSDGSLVELETTDIVYEILSVEDQKLFEEGIVVKTQEELAVLLQDFES